MEERRHIAVMFTDIVGYTALMGSDEDKAFDMLKRNHTIHATLIEKHNGTLIKEVGDGTLASFPLASDAVRCAIEIQNEAKSQEIPLKIGIHQGEMVMVGADVLGDGVNVASRLQESAEEGCISISGAVYRDVKNKAGITTEFIEEKSLKNVDEPIKVYRVLCEEQEQRTTSDESRAASSATVGARARGVNKPTYYFIGSVLILIVAVVLIWFLYPKQTPIIEAEPDRSIAVLPFDDMSPNKDQEYFSNGMTEEILLHLYKIGDLEVTSRTSSEKYDDTDKLIGEIATELGVKYILEGSVRKVGDRVRITAQLIDAFNDKHLWAESYDEELKDVFKIQSNIAKNIAKSLKAEISPELKERIERIPTKNLEAYNLYLKARYNMSARVADFGESTQILLEKAITLDPEFADAYAELAWYWLSKGGYGGDVESKIVAEKALPLLNKAIEINKSLADAHFNFACFYLWYKWDFQAAEREFNNFTELNPSTKERIVLIVDLMLATGRFSKALDLSEENLKNDQDNVGNWTGNALCYSFTNQAEKAIHQIETAIRMLPQSEYLIGTGMRVYLLLSMYEKVIELSRRYIEIRDLTFPRPLGILAIAYYHTDQKEKTENILIELIAKSDTTSVGSPAFYTAMIYAQMGETDLAFQYLEKAYDAHEVEMYWLKVEPPFEPIRDDPRWQVMLDKVGFPE
jgi:adenylate cyclase